MVDSGVNFFTTLSNTTKDPVQHGINSLLLGGQQPWLSVLIRMTEGTQRGKGVFRVVCTDSC